MKFKLSPLQSDIFITVFIIISLGFRFNYEFNQQISPLNSIAIGVAFIVMIWALIKLGFLNPNWFGLFDSKEKKSK